jgi:hypothetical protein
MKHLRPVLISLAAFACLPLAGCNSAPTPFTKSEEAMTPIQGQLADVPLPKGSNTDLDRSFVLGGNLGRLVIASRLSLNELFDFYRNEMARNGWQEVASVLSAVSVLTFQRSERVVTIQMHGTTLGGSAAEITVSPQGSGGLSSGSGYGGGGYGGGVTSAPASPVTSAPLSAPSRR